MRRVLIADDESKVGLLIKNLIEWERLELECVGLVRDGDTAYEKIKEFRPDIVITDIRMPGLSGLDLIRKVVEEKLHVRFIVVSGYKYFEYAQQAIRYGVEDYLLKPVDEVELNQILDRICASEREKEKENQRLHTAERKLSDSKYILHREFLESISHNGVQNLEEANKNYGLNFGQGVFGAFGIKIDRNIKQEKNEQQLQLIMKKIEKIVNQQLTPHIRDIVVTRKKQGLVMAVFNYGENHASDVENFLDLVYKKSTEYIDGFENYEMTMGISDVCLDFADLNKMVEMAKEAVDFRLLRGNGRIEAGTIMEGYSLCAEEILEEIRQKFLLAVETARYEDVQYQISSMFGRMRSRNAFPSEYYRLGERIFEIYREKMVENQENDDITDTWKDDIYHCRSLLELERFISHSLIEDLKTYMENSRERERKPILETLSYIKNHYGEKLSLEDISEQMGFNMNYFSELFKKETGKTFTVYVSEVRMEEAKKMLRDTNMAVYEIAGKVGYKDPKFFSQQFAKTVGLKPAEYRKLYY